MSPGDRKYIKTFPCAYNMEFTPYKQKQFSTETIKKIQNRLIATSNNSIRTSKAILVGDVSVGKTTILKRYCHGVFDQSYRPTIGVDFEIEYFQVLNVPFNLQIWDTAGQERFKCISEAYYRNSNIVIVAFDMTNKESLYEAPVWLKAALNANTYKQKLAIFLVGTKSDKLSHTEMQDIEKEAGQLALSLHAEYWSVSAKTGFKIIDFFRRVAAISFDQIIKDLSNNTLDGTQFSHTLKLKPAERKTESCFSTC